MRLTRDRFILALGLGMTGIVGCVPSMAAPVVGPVAAPRAADPQIQIQPLTADQLAQILGVNVWTAKYSGGPIECWLEIEEEGQATMPKRIPEKDNIGTGSFPQQSDGTVNFWWRKHGEGAGGDLHIDAAGSSYGYGLNNNAFVFGWKGYSASSTTMGQGKAITGEPGKEFVLIDYDARESLPQGEKDKAPRRVHLKLMARFAAEK